MRNFKSTVLSVTAVLTLLGGPVVASVATAGSASAAVTATAGHGHSSSSKATKATKQTTTVVSNPDNAVSTPRPRSSSVSTPRASRSVSAPSGVGGATASARAPRVVRAPTNTGSLVVGSISRTAPAARGAAAVPTTKVRVSGSTTKFGGATYRYEPASYWQTHRAPLRGSAAYWPYLNDPYVYSNYFNPLSPWHAYYLRYHTYYVTGYVVQDGYFVPASSGVGGTIALVIFGIIAFVVLLFVVLFFASRRRSSGPRPPRHTADSSIGSGWRE